MQFIIKLHLSSIKLGKLGIHVLNGILRFRKSSLELKLGHLKLFCLGKTINLILLSPHVRLILSFGKLAEQVVLGHTLFIKVFFESITLMLKISELSKKRTLSLDSSSAYL